MRAALPSSRHGSADPPRLCKMRIPASSILALSSVMAAGVVRDAAWLRRSMAILSPRLCSQSVLMSQAAAHCSRMACTVLCRIASLSGRTAGP
eukprot:1838750-Heterocapsa_arctica.AAC.2